MTQDLKPWARFLVDKNLKFVLYVVVLLVLPIRLMLALVLYIFDAVVETFQDVVLGSIDDIKGIHRQKKTDKTSDEV